MATTRLTSAATRASKLPTPRWSSGLGAKSRITAYQAMPAAATRINIPSKPLEKYSSVHGLPEQRFYNLLCLAYGADPKTFSRVAEDKYLPQTRAPDCQREWYQVAASFKRYILPHVDLGLAKQVLDKDWLPPESKKSLQDYMK